MRKALVLVLLLAGCDSVFQLYRSEAETRDAGADATVAVDGATDALPGCWGTSIFDEDNDALPDGCDLCPISPGGDDTDADGVGDVCDADPNHAQRYVMFDAFGTANAPDWVIDAGGWMADTTTGTFRITTASPSSRARRPLSGAKYPALETEVSIDRDAASIATAGLTGVFSAAAEVSCVATLDSSNQLGLVAKQGATVIASQPPGPLPASGRFKIRMTVKPDGLRCKLIDGTALLAAVGPATVPVDNVAAQIALTATEGRAAFFWAMATATVE